MDIAAFTLNVNGGLVNFAAFTKDFGQLGLRKIETKGTRHPNGKPGNGDL
jgi:hypothetical protein